MLIQGLKKQIVWKTHADSYGFIYLSKRKLCNSLVFKSFKKNKNKKGLRMIYITDDFNWVKNLSVQKKNYLFFLVYIKCI